MATVFEKWRTCEGKDDNVYQGLQEDNLKCICHSSNRKMDKTLPSDVNANSYAYRGTVEGREWVGRGVGRVELKKL